MGAFAESARQYHDAGANMLPVVEKHPPAGVPWTQWQRKRQTIAEIAELVAAYPDADVAMITGEGSGGVVDIEADGPSGERTLSDLRLPLPPTAMWISRRGPHRLYRWTASPLRTRKLHAGVEFRANRSYSILPPSSGRVWLTPGALANVAPLPEPWVEYVFGGEHYPSKPAPSIERTPLVSLDTACNLEQLFTQESVVAAVARALRIPAVGIGKAFCCVLPGHTERHPSATLCRNSRGAVVYHDWHRRSSREYLTLPEVRASLACGWVVRLSGPTLATWALRLLVEAKVLRPAAVECLIPLVPPSAGSVARSLRDGFALLLGCKWLHTFGEPTPFTAQFAALWCGLGEDQAGRGIRALIKMGVLRSFGKHKRATLFLPGGGIQ